MKKLVGAVVIFLLPASVSNAECLQVPFGESALGFSRVEASALSLIKAVKVQDLAAVKEALKNEAPVNCCDKSTQYTALMWAAHAGNADIVQELLRSGAEVNASAKDGETALILACNKGHHKVVQILLNCDEVSKKEKRLTRASVDAQTSVGITPLMFAALSGHVEVVRTLLLQGADLTVTDAQGNDVYYYLKLNPDIATAKAVFKLLQEHMSKMLVYVGN